jgi:GNAT superfamily N-acetyltransferase
MMATTITPERPDTVEAQALIAELEGELAPFYPSESRHGYNVEKLLAEGVAFFLIRVDGAPAACGGVQLFPQGRFAVGAEYAEVKRMYVRPQFLGRGLARQMLDHLAEHARVHGVRLLRLETGVHQQDAIRLYEGMGFQRILPFGEYRTDPLSRFYEKQIAEEPS